MAVIHALVGEAPACATRNWEYATSNYAATTCKRCLPKLVELAAAAEQAEAERRQEAMYAAACEELGVSHIWAVLRTDTPTERLMRAVFGAVILSLHESGEVS